jgi:hypothetical protein
MVQQVSPEEPAVRHAAAAVSSLYERFGTANAVADGDSFALQQYNCAISRLVATSDETVVLFVCVLMTCIESLQGNGHRAVEHCRHGVKLLNNASMPQSTRDQLLEVFCHMSTFPLFFGCKPSTFPFLEGMKLPSQSLSTPQTDIVQLWPALGVLMYRSAHLLLVGNEYRLFSNDPIPAEMLEEKRLLESSLYYWSMAFQGFKNSKVLSAERATACYLLEIKQIVTTIWLNSALEYDELVYDRHVESFRAIVNLASLALVSTFDQRRPKFTFEMGFLPPLHFVALKCRCLRTRVSALQFMRALAVDRENLWDAEVTYSIARQAILLEHGMFPDQLCVKYPLNTAEDMKLVAPRTVRILGTVIDPNSKVDPDGVKTTSILFTLSAADGKTTEWRGNLSSFKKRSVNLTTRAL